MLGKALNIAKLWTVPCYGEPAWKLSSRMADLIQTLCEHFRMKPTWLCDATKGQGFLSIKEEIYEPIALTPYCLQVQAKVCADESQ